MATRASSPYGPAGQTGPYQQKNDPWNTRRPPQWKPVGFTGGDTAAMMAHPQMQKWMSGLRGPDGEPLEEPPPPPPARFGGLSGGRSSMAALENAVGHDPNSLRDNLARGQKVVNERRSVMQREAMTGQTASGEQLGGPTIAARGMQVGASQLADHTPWGDFFTALVGKEANTGIASGGKQQLRVDVGGIGRVKAYDPALNKTYDVQGGEMPPKEYSAEQMDYIGRSQPALNALRRAIGLPGRVL